VQCITCPKPIAKPEMKPVKKPAKPISGTCNTCKGQLTPADTPELAKAAGDAALEKLMTRISREGIFAMLEDEDDD
jgi:hypothetical protein